MSVSRGGGERGGYWLDRITVRGCQLNLIALKGGRNAYKALFEYGLTRIIRNQGIIK